MEEMVEYVVGLMDGCVIGDLEKENLRFALKCDAKMNGVMVEKEEVERIVKGEGDRTRWEVLDNWVFMVRYNTEHPQ